MALANGNEIRLAVIPGQNETPVHSQFLGDSLKILINSIDS